MSKEIRIPTPFRDNFIIHELICDCGYFTKLTLSCDQEFVFKCPWCGEEIKIVVEK
jgi:C4-type Zn-finger protein